MTDDAELLRRYAEEDIQEAFAEVVQRHVDFVYSAALRQLNGNATLANDVTQQVFIDLARKAAQLRRHPALIGWLHTATRYGARFALRSEARRAAHERDPRTAELTESAMTADWTKVQPVIDEVLGGLRERERAAILLRFFEGKRLAEIGARLALSEAAARSCVDRALDKMRVQLAQRGVTSTAAGLAVALGSHVTIAAPAGVAASATTAGLAADTSGMGVWATLLTMSKIKIGIASVIVLAGLTTVAVDLRANRELRANLAAARGGFAEMPALEREAKELRREVTRVGDGNPEVAEVTRLRDRLAVLNARPPGVVDSELKPVVNAGRDTPTNTFFTFMAGLNAGDLTGVANLISFQNDKPEAREKFMTSLPEPVRRKYATPERVFAAGLFNLRNGEARADPAVKAQVMSSDDTNPGTVRVRLWILQASGAEREMQEKFTMIPQGWSIQFRPLSYERDAAEVRARFNPVTGEPLGKR